MTCPITADRDAWRGAVTQADALLAKKFWRVHPNEIIATGMTREEWYAHHIAAHRQQAEASFKAREDALAHVATDLLQHIDWLTCGLPDLLESGGLTDEEGLIGAAIDAANSARNLLARAHTAAAEGDE